MIESFDVTGEVASMTLGTQETIVCGLINGTLTTIDAGKFQISRVLERAHTGTVVSCLALKSSQR